MTKIRSAVATFLLGGALLAPACGLGTKVSLDAGEEDATPADFTPEPLALELSFTGQGGYDDFASPGAALGFAVDATQGYILVAALKFELPLASKEFTVNADIETTLAGYDGGIVPGFLDAAAKKYPVLEPAVTDMPGIRSMPVDIALFLLEGDPFTAPAMRVYVAEEGTVTLHRLDGPKDTLEGSATFTEVTEISKTGEVKPGGRRIALAPFYFEWETAQQ
jgi:hypothetical protein